ncbi:hypothetical protein [Desulfolucanica intricata]|uniref:hypothetical protein n=1 Tax=Desulfolucanica intricata TaxID=1285191 RepID=UPI00082BE767|nr:hypothetical protein [Desulfolucanica intricata]
MKWHGLRIPVILFAFLVGLALFFGCQWLYQKYYYNQPLAAVLSDDVVQAYKIDDSEEPIKIEVQLSTTNLMEDYNKIYDNLSGVMGNKAFVLELKDNRDKVLKEVYYNSQYAVYQAVSQGTYQEMASVIHEEAGAVGAEAKVFIDQNNIYVQMQHNGHVLNEIIPRNPPQTAMTAQRGGGARLDAQRN